MLDKDPSIDTIRCLERLRAVPGGVQLHGNVKLNASTMHFSSASSRRWRRA